MNDRRQITAVETDRRDPDAPASRVADRQGLDLFDDALDPCRDETVADEIGRIRRDERPLFRESSVIDDRRDAVRTERDRNP